MVQADVVRGIFALSALAGVALVLAACGGPADSDDRPKGIGPIDRIAGDEHEREASERPGRSLFAEKCAACHTLSAAGSLGTVGPNLDQVKPTKAAVLAALAEGGLGSGTMPKDLYTGEQAQQVAAYVAETAGK